MVRAALVFAALLSITIPPPASAIVGRHDADPALYRAEPATLPALVDLPESGHGVLIAPRWVLTVAHAVANRADSLGSVTIGGVERSVVRVFVHPDYRPLPGPHRTAPLPTSWRLRARCAMSL